MSSPPVAMLALGLLALATGPAHAKLPTAKAMAKALAKGLGPTPGNTAIVVLEEAPLAKPKPTASPPPPPTWRLRLTIGPTGLVLDRENLLLGTLDTQRFPRAAKAAGGAASQRRAPAWLRLLAGEDVATVARQAGVGSVTSLARHRRSILWVWGAGPRDRKSPQLHIHRKDGRLHRAIADGDDVTFEGVQDPKTPWGRRLPAEVTFRRGTTLVRFRVTQVQVTAQPRTEGASP